MQVPSLGLIPPFLLETRLPCLPHPFGLFWLAVPSLPAGVAEGLSILVSGGLRLYFTGDVVKQDKAKRLFRASLSGQGKCEDEFVFVLLVFFCRLL